MFRSAQYKYHFFFLFCLSYLLLGCIKSNPTLPDWVSSLPQDKQAYYSVGQGVSLYDAEINARVSMAAEISSTVSDLTQIHIVDDGLFQRQIFEQFTSVEVSKINLSQASIVHYEMLENRFTVLLKMLKSDLAVQLKSELAAEIQKTKVVVENSTEVSFEQWWKLRQVLPNIKIINRNIALLERIEGKLYEPEAALIRTYFKKFNQSYGARELEIKNMTSSNKIYDLSSKQLLAENIVVAKPSYWRRLPYIEVSNEYTQQTIGQEYYVDATLWVRLKSSQGQVLSEFNLNGRGVTYSSVQQSKAIADWELYNKLEKIDIIAKLID